MRSVAVTVGLAALCWLALQIEPGPAAGATATFIAGIVLRAGHLAGHGLRAAGLPRITGYLLAGLLLGPDVLGIISADVAGQLHFLNQLAVAFIALAAGAELDLVDLRQRWRLIGALVAGSSIVVLGGVSLVLFLASPVLLPFAAHLTPTQRLAVVGLFGVLAVARSPSSALAVIRECHAHGPFSETSLGVTVAIDVVTILLFAVAMSLCQTVLDPLSTLDLGFALSVVLEIAAGIGFGGLLGAVLAFYIARWPANISLVLLGTALVVTEVAHGAAHYAQATHDLPLHLEPLLICVTAGFVVRNLGKGGSRFGEAVDGVSLPVFVLFFTLAGAVLDLDALRYTWPAALVLVAIRAGTLLAGSWFGARVGGETPGLRGLYGWTFLTQAGVSIGLTLEVVRRFPEWGDAFATLVVAAISVNQMVGPVTMKLALQRAGEARTVEST